MKLLLINNGGGGFADYVDVPDGTTVRRWMSFGLKTVANGQAGRKSNELHGLG